MEAIKMVSIMELRRLYSIVHFCLHVWSLMKWSLLIQGFCESIGQSFLFALEEFISFILKSEDPFLIHWLSVVDFKRREMKETLTKERIICFSNPLEMESWGQHVPHMKDRLIKTWKSVSNDIVFVTEKNICVALFNIVHPENDTV